MITVNMKRYYGDANVTKSYLTIEDGTGAVLFSGEARECRFYDYAKGEKMPGASLGCLGTGEYRVVPASTAGCPICLRVTGEPTRRGVLLYVNTDVKRQRQVKRVLVGYGTKAEERVRQLTDLERAREDFTKLIYENYVEEFRVVVENEVPLSPRGNHES